MIYLKEEDNVISENIITSNNKKVTDELLFELSLEENYNLIDSKRYLGSPKVKDEIEDDKLITYKHIGFNGPGYQDYIYLRKEYVSKYPMSYKILETLGTNYSLDLAKLLNIDNYDLVKLEDIINNNPTYKDYLISNMYPDLYIFIKKIMNNINIAIKDITKIYSFDYKQTQLEQTAINNSKILTLARK